MLAQNGNATNDTKTRKNKMATIEVAVEKNEAVAGRLARCNCMAHVSRECENSANDRYLKSKCKTEIAMDCS